MLLVFIFKLLDGTFGTIKQIFITKEHYFKAAIMNSLASFFYFFMLQLIAKDNSLKTVLVATLAVFLGTYVPGTISKKLQKDFLFVFNITSYNKTKTEQMIEKLVTKKISHILVHSSDEFDYVKVFAENRTESKIVDEIIPKEMKYHIVPTRTFSF